MIKTLEENYLVFRHWLVECLTQNPPEDDIKVLYFCLKKEKEEVSITLFGSTHFDDLYLNWRNSEDYVPPNNNCPRLPLLADMLKTEEMIFIQEEQIWNMVAEFIRKFFKDNTTIINTKKITIGYANAGLQIIN